MKLLNIPFIAWCILLSWTGYHAQTRTTHSDGSIEVTGGTQTINSLDPGLNSIFTVEDMTTLNFKKAIELKREQRYTIWATMPESDSYVQLTLYSWDAANNTRGGIVFRGRAQASTATGRTNNGINEYRLGEVGNLPSNPGDPANGCLSTNIACLARTANTYLPGKLDPNSPQCHDLYVRSWLPWLFGGYFWGSSTLTEYYHTCTGPYYVDEQPVVVELEIQNARVYSINFSGLKENVPFEIITGSINQTHNVTVGDVIPLQITLPTGSAPPEIHGLPKTWIARFAGDLRYFVHENHQPGTLTPWIGFDSQVHWLNLRNYVQEPGRQNNYTNWTTTDNGNGTTTYSLNYTVPVPMGNSTAPQAYKWDKFSKQKTQQKETGKLHGDAWIQRANQKEGLNMQLLHYWNNDNDPWSNESDYTAYDGIKYMMGFDDDEILYIHDPYYDGYSNHGGVNGSYAILQEPMRWQIVPKMEGESVDDCVNAMVSAYYQYNDAGQSAEGHEIQDLGTDEQNPQGTGNWITEPGLVKLYGHDTSETLFINATTPFGRFYAFDGPSVPGGGALTTYTLTGMTGQEIYNTYLSQGYKLTVEYETQDGDGSLIRNCSEANGWSAQYTSNDFSSNYSSLCTHQVYSSDNTDSNTAGVNPFLTASTNTENLSFTFTTYPGAYCSVTLYVENTSAHGEKVALAGMAVTPVILAFMEDQNLVNGTGEGGYFFVEQQRRVQTLAHNTTNPHNVSRGNRYVSPFVRTYTFFQNESSNWKVWDSDPHKFGGSQTSPDTDWYQSNKKLAHRVFDEEIDSENLVTYYFDPITTYDANQNGYLDQNELQNQICSARECALDYSNYPPGEYQLTALYRGVEPIRHKVVIKETETGQLAGVKSYDLSDYDKALVNLIAPTDNQLNIYEDYVVLEVHDLYSRFMYHLGQRNNYENNLSGLTEYNVTTSSEKFSKVNRWGPHLDFEGRFIWEWRTDTDEGTLHSAGLPGNAFFDVASSTTLWNLSVPNQIAGQSDVDSDYAGPINSFPGLWGNHFSSLWKTEGPSGVAGPSYMPTSNLSHDVNDFSTHIDNYFTLFPSHGQTSSWNYYWQYRATLNSWADSYGYRMRYNPSHIYDITRVFNDDHGAFSGNTPSVQYDDGSSKRRQPYPSDNWMNLEQWFYDLIFGRKVIVLKSQYNNYTDFNIYSDFSREHGMYADPNAYASANGLIYMDPPSDLPQYSTLVHLCIDCEEESTVTSSSAKEVVKKKDNDIAEDPEITEEAGTEMSVYPIPAEEYFTIRLKAQGLSPLYMALYDIKGLKVWEHYNYVEKGMNRFEVDRSKLSLDSGVYILKCSSQEGTQSRKIVLQ